MASNASRPPPLIYPIPTEMMNNPVLLPENGQSYERSASKRWLKKHKTSPQTKKKLKNPKFVINNDRKSTNQEFRLYGQILDSKSDFDSFNLRRGRPPGDDWLNKPKLEIVISLLGSSNVGKSYLANNAASIQISQERRLATTMGMDMYYFYLDRLFEGKYIVTIRINDCPGDDRYESVSDRHFRNCHGAILIVDTKDIKTLERLEAYWYKQLREKNLFDSVEMVLACNKIDLLESCDSAYRETLFKRTEEFAARYLMTTINISALRGDNIHPMFHRLISNILQNPILLNDLKGNQKHIQVTPSNRNGGSSCFANICSSS